MESELAIDASREAIKVCLMVGGPILGVCLIVGLLMGLAQAMSNIQDQALATVPKILAILALVGLALPWFADRMVDFSKAQFSKPMMAANSSIVDDGYRSGEVHSLLDPSAPDNDYYPRPEATQLPFVPASFTKERIDTPQNNSANETKSPFSLPSYRFTRRPNENIEG
jgi:flagellar biosynthetic protein FliQ